MFLKSGVIFATHITLCVQNVDMSRDFVKLFI